MPRGELGEVHHRKLRSQGVDHRLNNLLALHPECHRLAHAEVAWAIRHGWIVHGWAVPGTVEVVRCRGGVACGHD